MSLKSLDPLSTISSKYLGRLFCTESSSSPISFHLNSLIIQFGISSHHSLTAPISNTKPIISLHTPKTTRKNQKRKNAKRNAKNPQKMKHHCVTHSSPDYMESLIEYLIRDSRSMHTSSSFNQIQ